MPGASKTQPRPPNRLVYDLLADRVRPVYFEVGQDLRPSGVAARPVDRDALHLVRLAKTKGHRQLALAEVAAGAGDLAALDALARFQRNPRAKSAAVRVAAVAFEGEANPMVAGAPVIAEQSG